MFLVVVVIEEDSTWFPSALRITLATVLASFVFLLSLSVCAYRADDVVIEQVAPSLKESVPGQSAFLRLQPALKNMCAQCFAEAFQRDPSAEGSALLGVEVKSDTERARILFKQEGPSSPVFMGCVRRYGAFDLEGFQNQESKFSFVASYQKGGSAETRVRLRLIDEGEAPGAKAPSTESGIPERPLGD